MMLIKPFSLLRLVAVLMLASACSEAKQVNLTMADRNKQVEIKAGGMIIIKLDGNPSTGFTWEVKELDNKLFEQVGEATFVNSNPGLIGSGGTLSLTFKALLPGNSSLTLVYHRPWEIGVSPIDTFTITVHVK
jgi:inhibitor of cysteine peptidase